MNFPEKYFTKFNFTKEQTLQYHKNAKKDLQIAIADKILDVKFTYSYTALIKSGITALSFNKVKVKSVPGGRHHAMIIEKLSEMIGDPAIADLGNLMRSKRNTDLYSGGISITEKECKDYLDFIKKVLKKVEDYCIKQ